MAAGKNFTALEQAALQEFCSTNPDIQTGLEAQLATATVIQRENSGAGFFTYMAVNRSAAPIKNSERVLSGVVASVEGFQWPLIFLLFLEHGYAHMLEIATTDESTVGLDPSALRLEISN
jgi:hypothetical protein